MKIAIIGTGIMGRGMTQNFLKHNHQVIIWNRTPENAQSLVDAEAKIVGSPKEATEQADIVFEVTANDESSQEVWLGENGILAGADRTKFLIASSTLSIEWIDTLIEHTKEYKFMDMPLTGGRMGAESGNLTLLVGGEEELLNELKPTLQAIASKFHYFGKRGSGMRFKLLLNMIQGIHIGALGETLKIAKENGMDINAVGEALADRPGGVITNLAWQCYQNDPDPINFSVNWIKKDLEYAKRFADTVDTPLLDDMLAKYQEATEKGMGEEDWTAITKF